MRQQLIHQLSAITQEEKVLLEGGGLDMGRYNRNGSPVMDPGTLIPNGRLFGIRPHTRFTAFPPHTHNYVEMVYQIQGHSVHHMEHGPTLTLSPGQLLLLSRGSTHSIDRCGREDLAVNFILIPQFFDNAAVRISHDSALSVFLTGNLQKSPSQSGYLLFDTSGAVQVENLLENLVASALEQGSQMLQQLTLELLLLHLSQMSQRLVIRSQQDREQAMVMEVLSQVEQSRDCALSQLAQRFGVSDSYLSRIIHRRTGCTFTQLLHSARFTRAAALLRDTQLPITDIAAAVGYDNTSFFYRQFAQRYGCTPKEYRLVAQEKSDIH
jgi:AraC family transcriptional regulator, L-rhamnose operon regulatory protein RhaS